MGEVCKGYNTVTNSKAASTSSKSIILHSKALLLSGGVSPKLNLTKPEQNSKIHLIEIGLTQKGVTKGRRVGYE